MRTEVEKRNIPKGWRLESLADIADVIMGQSPKSSSYNQVGNGLPFYQGNADFTDSYRVKIRQWTNEPTKLSQPGDILLSVRAPVGDVAINDTNACIGRGLAAIRSRNTISDQSFLFQVIQGLSAFLNAKAQGSTFTAINGPALKKIPLLIPPITEQKKIAEVLETVDDQIQKTDEVIAATEKLKRGLMQQLFKYSHMALLDSVAKRGSGHTPNKQHPEYWNGGVKWASLADSSKLDNRYLFQTNKEISLQGVKNSSAVLHAKNTVIVCRDAGIGRVAILGADDMAVSQHFIAWRCSKNLNFKYLYYWLQSQKSVLEQIATGTTIKTIGLSFFRNLQIPLLNIHEQEKVGDTFWIVDEKISVNQKLKERLIMLKKGLMQDLLSGRVRVPNK